jgi:hypothetical protein
VSWYAWEEQGGRGEADKIGGASGSGRGRLDEAGGESSGGDRWSDREDEAGVTVAPQFLIFSNVKILCTIYCRTIPVS